MRRRTFAGLFIAVITTLTISVRAMPTVVIHVDADAASGGDGSDRRPFNDISLALERARTVLGRVIVKVAPGDYPIATTLVIDRSIDLRGSTAMIDDADGWPTGEYTPTTATRIFASDPALGTLVLVDSGHDTAMSDVNIRGFIFQSSAAGISLLMRRDRGRWISVPDRRRCVRHARVFRHRRAGLRRQHRLG